MLAAATIHLVRFPSSGAGAPHHRERRGKGGGSLKGDKACRSARETFAMSIQIIPLNKLRLSPHNVRKTGAEEP